MYLIKFSYLCLISYIFRYGDCCTFPADLQNGTWLSNDMGDITFNSTHFTASSIATFGAITFECTELSGNRYFSVSAAFPFAGPNYLKAAICFELEKMTSYKYSYYLLSNVLDNTDVNRMLLKESTYVFTSAETCSLSATAPTQARLFVRDGYANETASTCDNQISGIYEYNVTGSTCNETSLNVCDDRRQLAFNYSLCSDVMAYSAGGQLYCMWNSVIGNNVYTLLYNQDATTDESTYYRFTCLVSSTTDNATYISTYPRACLDNQNGSETTSPGLTAVMYSNYSCAEYTTPITNTTITTVATTVTIAVTAAAAAAQVLSAGGAAAVVIGVILLIAAAIIIGVLVYFKVFKRKKITPDDGVKDGGKSGDTDFIPAKSPPINTQEEMKTGRVSPFSPYPTVSELACYRFGPEPATVDFDDDDGGITLEATTPGFTEGRRTKYEKDNESQASLPVYSEVGDPTPDPTRLSEVQTVMSEITITENITDPTPFTMTRATMNIPEENTVSPMESPRNTE